MTDPPALPAAFLGHGSPMNALERNRYSDTWRAFGADAHRRAARPRAILVISAHWYTGTTAVTAMAKPKTIHDFYGFPPALHAIDYPAPGLPELAAEIADAAQPDYVGADADGWGLDHGAWSVLVHAFPAADVPVVQLSINAQKPPEWHVALGAKLAPLRDRVIVVGSGNVVHNLRAMDPGLADEGYDWARRFDEHARQVLTERPGDAAELVHHPDYRIAAPTPEHFLPVLYLAGLAAAANERLDVLVDGYAFGSISMTCYGLGARCPTDIASRS
ncbi:MAG TPA: 4,5-DOPA dioxygenase extradiol, partial [Xanthomonadales bacterium]|nr:4,5-DOPA dioxygenase extradiol [Xanthomonadales bacterium]